MGVTSAVSTTRSAATGASAVACWVSCCADSAPTLRSVIGSAGSDCSRVSPGCPRENLEKSKVAVRAAEERSSNKREVAHFNGSVGRLLIVCGISSTHAQGGSLAVNLTYLGDKRYHACLTSVLAPLRGAEERDKRRGGVRLLRTVYRVKNERVPRAQTRILSPHMQAGARCATRFP